MNCPQCGKRMFIQADFCPNCKHAVTVEDRERGRALWKERHPHVEIGKGKNQGNLAGGNGPAAPGEADRH